MIWHAVIPWPTGGGPTFVFLVVPQPVVYAFIGQLVIFNVIWLFFVLRKR